MQATTNNHEAIEALLAGVPDDAAVGKLPVLACSFADCGAAVAASVSLLDL